MVAGLPKSFQFMKPQAAITGTVPTATQPAIGKMENKDYGETDNAPEN